MPIDVLKIVTLGPPAAGKTQLKKGLLGNFDPSDDSTPMSTRPTVVVERYIQNESKWVEFTMEKSKQQLNLWVSSRSTSPGESMDQTAQTLEALVNKTQNRRTRKTLQQELLNP